MQYLDCVGWTLPDFMRQIEDLAVVREPRPDRFRYQDILVGTKQFRIESDGWRIAGDRLCGRYARIRGAAMDIATVMIYPTASPDVFPVFAAEWVVFGDRVHALILDVEVCGEQPALVGDLATEFDSVGSAWCKQFPENRERPDWFQSIAMPWVLYGCCEADRIPGIRRAFNEYLQRTVRAFYLPRLAYGAAGPDAPEVAAYKHHHYVNSPGHRLMGVKLGQH